MGIEEAGVYHVALTSDEKRFGGFDNITVDSKYFTTPMEWNGRKNWLQVRGSLGWTFAVADRVQVYLPPRTCVALAKN